MKTSNLQDKEVLARQYRDSTSLDIRRNFHKKYRTNLIDYADWILSNIHFFQGCRVLEVGCGTGNLWENAARSIEKFNELVLTDISEGMIEIARRKFSGRKNVRAQVVDILDIPFEEDSFDIIIANSMLYHVADMDLALRNIHSILRFGGVFYATTFGRLGLIHTINRAMFEMGLSDSKEISDISFSLENGEELLWKQFLRVKKVTYDANLEVSEISDLVDYIFSMSSMSHVDGSNREKVSAYFESKKDGKGLLQIPQTYGMFIAST